MGGLKSADAYEFEKTKGNTKCRLKKGEDENERKDGPKWDQKGEWAGRRIGIGENVMNIIFAIEVH